MQAGAWWRASSSAKSATQSGPQLQGSRLLQEAGQFGSMRRSSVSRQAGSRHWQEAELPGAVSKRGTTLPLWFKPEYVAMVVKGSTTQAWKLVEESMRQLSSFRAQEGGS